MAVVEKSPTVLAPFRTSRQSSSNLYRKLINTVTGKLSYLNASDNNSLLNIGHSHDILERLAARPVEDDHAKSESQRRG